MARWTALSLVLPLLLASAPALAKRAPAPPPAPTAPADVAAPPDDAQRTESGLAFRVLTPGPGGDHPTEQATVTVTYAVWTADGALVDASVTRGGPASFPLRAVIAGMREGVQLMARGDTFRLWIPEDLAYRGAPGMPAGTLVFDVTLLDFVAPPDTPPDVAAPPDDALRTATGLAYRVLTPGTGTTHPTAKSEVAVHYAGWTTDGALFDTSWTRGAPFRCRPDQVIAGWTEGLQLMVEGETTRFWIPEDLAYQGRPGAPAGMLVFDVSLLEIEAGGRGSKGRR
jgi:peptidylprolyl isomerase